MAKPYRKIPYPIGFLSLSLLPLLCFGYLNKNYFLNHDYQTLEVRSWGKRNNQEIVQLRKLIRPGFQKIVLNGESDQIKLDYAEVIIDELLSQSDTTRGIEFTFTDQAKYSGFVRLFELCEIHKVPSYLSYGNKLWVFSGTPAPDRLEVKNGKPICGGSWIPAIENPKVDVPISKFQKIMACCSLTIFSFMITLSVFRHLRNHRDQTLPHNG